jgi:hypothetical protein
MTSHNFDGVKKINKTDEAIALMSTTFKSDGESSKM